MNLVQHLQDVAGGGGGMLLVSAAFRALPEPSEKAGGFYRWFYRFGHLLFTATRAPTSATPPPAGTPK